MKNRRLITLILAGLLLTGCSATLSGDILNGPTPMPGAAQTPLAQAEVNFTVNPPLDTPDGSSLSLEIVDPVTGLGFHGQRHPMERLESGQWEVSLNIPIGSLVRYRYWQTAPDELVEHSSIGEAVRYRVAHVTSSMQFIDQVASWQASTANENAGRIFGQLVEAGSQQPIPEMIVTAAGIQSFTDGQGRFRLEGVPEGLNNLVAYHPDGAYRTVQQGAIVAAGGTTPANFAMEAAEEVTMTFQVNVPPGKPTDQPIRLVGNVYSLGDVFSSLPGGVEISAVRAPTLIPVDDTNFILLARMYAGTDLRYKYSLGDGLWNAERSVEGAFRTRQLIVPETDTIQADVVESWQESGQPTELLLKIGNALPQGEQVGIQFDPFSPFEPLPAVQAGEGQWRFWLYSPLSSGQSVNFNLCRNLECGRAQSIETYSFEAGAGTEVERQIEGWQWWPGPSAQPQIVANAIAAQEERQLGLDLVPRYRPSWVGYDSQLLQQVGATGANALTVSPSWLASDVHGTPLLKFDPAHDRYQQDWLVLAQAARDRGLRLSVRPDLTARNGSLDQWWQQGARDSAWWTTTNDQIQGYLLTQANLAERMQADRFILDGSQLGPALPGGRLADGSAANQPLAAETYWRDLVGALRSEFSGELVFELELHEDLSPTPSFLEAFDSVQIYWHAPLADAPGQTIETMQLEAARYLDLEILPRLPEAMPVSLSLEYLSIANAAGACPPSPSGGCRDGAEFDVGAIVDESISVDLEAQAQALNAILLEVNERPRINGIYLRRYYPLAAMQDKSASIHGKPAQQLIRHWYLGWDPQ